MRALQNGLRKALGIDGSLEDIDFAGRTDRWIMRQIFAKFSLPATEENFAQTLRGLRDFAAGRIEKSGRTRAAGRPVNC